jgi:dihydroxyacid dehydratase/phosphogluconate dehydratase
MSDRSPAPRRSRLTLEGLERTSHRTFMRALGLDEAAMAKPFVGVMSTHGENTPCSLSLRPQAEAAKLGSPRRAARHSSSPPSRSRTASRWATAGCG